MEKRTLLKHPFPPVVRADAELLILGSVPSRRSVADGFYYMHPANRFWKVLSALYGADFYTATRTEKVALLQKNRIALYDAVDACSILGSSDAAVSHVVPADIAALVAGTAVRTVFTNGTLSYQLTKKHNPALTLPIVPLPSTSPANARMGLADLIRAWSVILMR